MPQITLYRLTAETDSLDSTSDKVVFNAVDAPDFKVHKREGAYCTMLERVPSKGRGDNQGVGQDLGDIQSLGNVEDVYMITGFVERRSGNDGDGNNAILRRLKAWDQEFAVNPAWPHGRFGLRDEGDHSKDVVPSRAAGSQVGLIWESVRYRSVFSKDREEIAITLLVTKGE